MTIDTDQSNVSSIDDGCIIDKYLITNLGQELRIIFDEFPNNPRESSDCLGALKGYGDYSDYSDTGSLKNHIQRVPLYMIWEAYRTKGDLIILISFDPYMKIYKWRHFDNTINSETFDEINIDLIYHVPKARLLEEYRHGYNVLDHPIDFLSSRIPRKVIEEIVIPYVIAEIEEYTAYMRGDVFGWELIQSDNNIIIDSCFGYCSHDGIKLEDIIYDLPKETFKQLQMTQNLVR